MLFRSEVLTTLSIRPPGSWKRTSQIVGTTGRLNDEEDRDIGVESLEIIGNSKRPPSKQGVQSKGLLVADSPGQTSLHLSELGITHEDQQLSFLRDHPALVITGEPGLFGHRSSVGETPQGAHDEREAHGEHSHEPHAA